MNIAKMIASGVMGGGAAAPKLFHVDFSTVDDGALPSSLDGVVGWAVSSGKALNNTAMGDELLADPGLEDWLSDTNLNSYNEVLQGTTTINKESTEIHGGSYSARLDVDASASESSIQPLLAADATKPFAVMSYWAKSSAGTPRTISGVGGIASRVISTDWQQLFGDFIHYGTAASWVYLKNSTGSASLSIYFDDLSIKRQSAVNSFAVHEYGVRSCVKVVGQVPLGSVYCAITSLDDQSNPQNYLILRVQQDYCYLYKCVGGVVAPPITSGAITYNPGAAAEIIWVDATTVEARYNGQRVGTAQTISDAGILAGTYAGFAAWRSDATVSDIKIQQTLGKSIFPIGDSITALSGTDEVDGNGWPAALINLYTDKVWRESPARYASGGYKVSDTKAGIDAALAARSDVPDYVFIYLGANDVVSMPTESAYKTNYAYILDAIHAKWASAKIYCGIGGRTGSEANTASLTSWTADVIADGRSSFSFPGINWTPMFSGLEATYLTDSVHPNHAGHVVMAQAWKALGIAR